MSVHTSSERKNIEEARTSIYRWLRQHNFEIGVAGGCTHHRGIPFEPNVLVRPLHSKHPGAKTIVVTTTRVLVMHVDKPFEENNWVLDEEYPYSDLAQLLQTLKVLVYPLLGIWGKDPS